MEVPEFVNDFPITLANWHSSSSHGVPVTTIRDRTLYEQDYIDSGGAGIYVHRPDSTTFKPYQLKSDSMGTSPFYPKCFAIPLSISSRERLDQVSENFELEKEHTNSLFYSARLECFFYADPITNRLQLYKLERSEESPALTKIQLISSENSVCQLPTEENGSICEISPAHYDHDVDETFFIRSSKSISLLKLEDQDEQLVLTNTPIIFKPEYKKDKRVMNNFDAHTRFWKISKSRLLRPNLAIGQRGEDDNIILSDFNIETQQFIWSCNSAKTDYRKMLTWQSPSELFWVRDHPKLLAFCEANQFALLDTRSKGLITSVMDRKELKYARDWEKFRGCCPLSISDTQFLISLDHKVILVDRRYPQRNLLTWSLMLPSTKDNLPRFLSSTTMLNSSQSFITLANDTQPVLMTVDPFEIPNIVQPKSLHMPLHLSSASDCWHFSSNGDEDLEHQLEQTILTGLIIIPTENGFSVVQSTSADHLYVQDFYPASEILPEHRMSWNRSCLFENYILPDGINSLLESIFAELSPEPELEDIDKLKDELNKLNKKLDMNSNVKSNEEAEVASSDEGTDDEHDKSIDLLKLNKIRICEPDPAPKPNLLMPLPGSSDFMDSQLSTENQEANQLAELVDDLVLEKVRYLSEDPDIIMEKHKKTTVRPDQIEEMMDLEQEIIVDSTVDLIRRWRFDFLPEKNLNDPINEKI